MALDFENVLASVALTARPDAAGSYLGPNLDLDYRRVFGGQILAQTIAALARTEPGKTVKSLTQLFPREGDMGQDMAYDVSAYQNGRTFGSFGVLASQSDKVVSIATASLHVPEAGLERQDEAPKAGAPEDSPQSDLGMIPWECRIVDGVSLSDPASSEPHLQFWTRTPPLTEGGWIHQALLAYATDLTLIGTALRPVDGLSQADTGVRFHSAVTTHTLWFHRDFRIDDWLLVDQHSPILSGGRSFGRGDVWTRSGDLVASFAQEAMIRML